MDPFKMKKKLNTVGPGFCLAKWEQVTLHLHNGTTHSCYHPIVHPVPISELKNNYKAIDNTKYKKQQRKMMLEGERPKECSYCWNIEDSDPENGISDRMIKSSTIAPENFEKIKNHDWSKDYNPSYIEVSFGANCNFKCSYCSPLVSTTWMKEIKSFGPYKISNGSHVHNLNYYKENDLLPIIENSVDKNPYIKAFWDWFPELYPNLRTLRVTGGEPLMNKNSFKILDWVLNNPRPDLELCFNSNLNPPDILWDKFLNYLEKFRERKYVKNIILYVSIESWEKKAEYVRYGLNFEKFWNNMLQILNNFSEVQISIMGIYNALSITSFSTLLERVTEIKCKYNKKDRWALYIDSPYLELPEFQSLNVLPTEFCLDNLNNQIKYMEKNSYKYVSNNKGYYESEICSLLNIVSWVKSNEKRIPKRSLKKKTLMSDFYMFFSEFDNRKKTNFLDTFPELGWFWKECKELVCG